MQQILAEHAHDATDDLDGAGWHGTMNYSGFTRPIWSWLRHPEFQASFLGVPSEVPIRSAHQISHLADFIIGK